MKYILIGILTIIVVSVVVILFNPLRRSEEQIRDDMLKLTPIGTNMEEVVVILEKNNKWEIRYISKHGYSMIGGWPTEPSPHEIEQNTVIGKKSINVYLGSYNVIVNTGVSL